MAFISWASESWWMSNVDELYEDGNLVASVAVSVVVPNRLKLLLLSCVAAADLEVVWVVVASAGVETAAASVVGAVASEEGLGIEEGLATEVGLGTGVVVDLALATEGTAIEASVVAVAVGSEVDGMTLAAPEVAEDLGRLSASFAYFVAAMRPRVRLTSFGLQGPWRRIGLSRRGLRWTTTQ